MHLSILIENMRRENYEICCSTPRVLYKEIDGKLCEPMERVSIDVPDDAVGSVMQKLGARKSIILMGGLGTVVYVVGVLVGVNGIWLVGASGALFSIVYPTGVLFLQELFPKQSIATATGLVLSIATMFDVGFNAVFGNLLEAVGFGVCRVIFPTAMGLFFLLFLAVTGRRAGQTPEHLI